MKVIKDYNFIITNGDYINHFVVIFCNVWVKLNFSYYASITLDAFKDLLCSKLCWHNRQHGHWVAIVISARVKQYIYTRVNSYIATLYTARSALSGIDLHHAENQKHTVIHKAY